MNTAQVERPPMDFIKTRQSRRLASLVLLALPWLVLEGLRLVLGAPFSLSGFATRGLLSIALLGVVWALHLSWISSTKILIWVLFGILLLASSSAYWFFQTTLSAWVLLGALFALLLAFEALIGRGLPAFLRWLLRLFLAILFAGGVTAIAQIETHFSDEEFFVAIQAAILAVFWLLAVGLWNAVIPVLQRESNSVAPQSRSSLDSIAMRGCLISGLFPFILAAAFGLVWKYQHSFFTPSAPEYPGITASSPFLCGEDSQETPKYDGRQVFQNMLKMVQANPAKGVPELGMLALGTGQESWAEEFHNALLQEVAEGQFTGPAQSVKSIQFDAALRAYYYPRVLQAFPGLFSEAEKERVREWFRSINRRALSVEWVDWMYGLAFSKLPEGPYENQESGAGLLALLEARDLGDPSLHAANTEYLLRNQRGWLERFRNTDDAAFYQPVWIYNAYFQALYWRQVPDDNLRNAFQWLLLQWPVDGEPLHYNHPAPASPGVFYLGARLLEVPQYVWIAGRGLEALAQEDGYLSAVPGAEVPVDIQGAPPQSGSCLLYGNSGLPNQSGPLAPDKVVLRQNWQPNASYALLNLRFSGWHRYKATNAIISIDQNGPLVVEKLSNETFGWLPVGRSLFRDKRVPRENLNGLLVERNGMSAVVYSLTGVGSFWAQDPPYYASVDGFQSSAQFDSSRTSIEDWRGWDHSRSIFLSHQGPIVVLDQAEKTRTRGSSSDAAIIWHLRTSQTDQNGVRAEKGAWRYQIRGGDQPAEVALLPLKQGFITVQGEDQSGAEGASLLFQSRKRDQLGLVSIFLSGDWMNAKVNLDGSSEKPILKIRQASQEIEIPLASTYEDK